MNPLWGSSETPYIRVSEAAYHDGDHEVRKQCNGSLLPTPRKVQLKLFLKKSDDSPDSNNYHLSQFGQWVTHDITLLPPDSSGPKECCSVPIDEINSNSPYQCQLPIELPEDDPVHGRHDGKTCMEFRRAMTAANNFNCSITPQIPMNQATSFIDASQLYGHKLDKANSIRSFNGGRLLTDVINENEYCPLRKRKGSLVCDGRDNVDVCFEAGDPRINQHLGLTSYSVVFTRFHNVVADKLQKINKQWPDEKVFQEARKILGAVNQIIVYRDYLPILLGKSFTKRVGLDLCQNRRTKYNSSIIPQLTIAFVGGAFRVPHTTVASYYNYVDKDYEIVDSVKLNEWMSKPDPLVKDSKFDEIVRGMTTSAGRFHAPSYNYLISNFMFHNHKNGDTDLLSVDIQRGRDVGLPSYIKMREWCGLPEICSFEELSSFVSKDDLDKLKELYVSVKDIDLLVGALLEPPVDGGTVGPTAQCIIADVFHRVRFCDRFFFDVRGQPGSYSEAQLDKLKQFNLGLIICATTKLDEVPNNIFEPSRNAQMVKCQDYLSDFDLSAWRESP
ncbi:peroxidase-like isoform X2 [Myzus persicae]|nr:peroxidase-like isoform X2 [Myzus persicae]